MIAHIARAVKEDNLIQLTRLLGGSPCSNSQVQLNQLNFSSVSSEAAKAVEVQCKQLEVAQSTQGNRLHHWRQNGRASPFMKHQASLHGDTSNVE
ncbi:hypothetical protein V6N13_025250 [Hibiscus sabdariffa]|uniref:Uncharacterized protein n=1 Tax=Hibiscus sabdariffa TaxID=183260 RepID=A0ABR2N726_9ROSI